MSLSCRISTSPLERMMRMYSCLVGAGSSMSSSRTPMMAFSGVPVRGSCWPGSVISCGGLFGRERGLSQFALGAFSGRDVAHSPAPPGTSCDSKEIARHAYVTSRRLPFWSSIRTSGRSLFVHPVRGPGQSAHNSLRTPASSPFLRPRQVCPPWAARLAVRFPSWSDGWICRTLKSGSISGR